MVEILVERRHILVCDNQNDDKKDSDDKNADKKETIVSADETEVIVTETIVSTASQTEKSDSIFASVWFWIILAVIVVGGGAVAVLADRIRKNSKA